jgi:hypothetical protein
MGYAKVAGMDTELQLSVGARYSICLIVFFPAYMIFEIPSNMSLVRFGVWKTLIAAWGIIVMGMGFVQNWVCQIYSKFNYRARSLHSDSSWVYLKEESLLEFCTSSAPGIAATKSIFESLDFTPSVSLLALSLEVYPF